MSGGEKGPPQKIIILLVIKKKGKKRTKYKLQHTLYGFDHSLKQTCFGLLFIDLHSGVLWM